MTAVVAVVVTVVLAAGGAAYGAGRVGGFRIPPWGPVREGNLPRRRRDAAGRRRCTRGAGCANGTGGHWWHRSGNH